MKKALLLLLFISSTALADTSCQDTTEYKFYKNVLGVNLHNWAIDQNKKYLKQFEGMRPTPQVNEQINSTIVAINQSELGRQLSFASYKKMGGKANSHSSLERLKSPCSNEYSDTNFIGQELRESARLDREEYRPPNKPDNYESPIGEYTGDNEYVLTDFGRGENRNGSYGEGNGRKSNTDRQGDGQSDLQKAIESGLSLYQLFKK